MKLFEIIIHSIFIILSIICFISMYTQDIKYSSTFFFTGISITCVSAVILLSGEKIRSKQLKTKIL
jgi:hypothetical protein